MEYRRLLIAALLSLAVVFLWQSLFPPTPPPAPVEAPASQEAPRPEAGAPSAQPSPGETQDTPVEPAPTAEAAEPGAAPELPAEPIVAAAEEAIRLESERFVATFTNRGAQLRSLQLREQRNADGSPVELVHERADGPWPFALIEPGGRSSALNDALFQVERFTVGPADELIFRYRGDAGAAEKRFHVEENGLLSVEVRAAGEWLMLLGPMVRDLTEAEMNGQFSGRGAVYRVGGQFDTVKPGDLEAPRTIAGAGLVWVGLQDNYFLSALLPRSPVERALLVPYLMVPDEAGGPVRFVPRPAPAELTPGQEDLAAATGVWIEPRGGELQMLAYLGVKRYDRLQELPGGLQQTVLPGIMGALAKPLLWGLNWLYGHGIPNYGWAIVLMTIAIKILLFPLTHKSLVSMQKMQELSPKVQAIRQKYRSKMRDKQGRPNMEAQRQMNEEMMALYKAEGINPASGCLPMLLQLPILFAFYRLLYSAVELRGAAWILWIRDLSEYDPYFVLPIVMGATQLLQTLMAPQAGNPLQRRMFLLMPVVFTILFLKFPSGLVLYWLVNNVLTIVQQMVIKRMQAEPEGKAVKS